MDPKESTTQIGPDGQPAIPQTDTENDNSAAPSADEQTTDHQAQSDGGQEGIQTDKKDGDDKGFGDHPRWQEREKTWKERFNLQERRHVDELDKIRKEMDEKIGALSSGKNSKFDAPADIPEWFNGDEKQWQAFQEYNQSLVSKAREDAEKNLTAKQKEEEARIKEATDYFHDQVTAIETDSDLNPDGEKVDQNKLLKFVVDNDLVDSKGRWNYRAGFKMLKNSDKKNQDKILQDRKKIAAATTSDKRADDKPANFMTSDDFKKPGARPW